MTSDNDELIVGNYVVAFIDLLGQKSAMPDRHLPLDKTEAIRIIKNSVGKIVGTQKNFETFYSSYSKSPTIYSQLSPVVQKLIPDMAPGVLTWQYFSDGLVVYIPLADGAIKSPINSIYSLLLAVGMLCVTGLAARGPIRAGVDIGWAVEYRPNELYGSAIAYAYNLESQIAKWPRVVVGHGLTEYLLQVSEMVGSDPNSEFKRKIAKRCLGYLSNDKDGHQIVDYLGENFRSVSSGSHDLEVIQRAHKFVQEQLAHWSAEGDKKLTERYENLDWYFTKKN